MPGTNTSTNMNMKKTKNLQNGITTMSSNSPSLIRPVGLLGLWLFLAFVGVGCQTLPLPDTSPTIQRLSLPAEVGSKDSAGRELVRKTYVAASSSIDGEVQIRHTRRWQKPKLGVRVKDATRELNLPGLETMEVAKVVGGPYGGKVITYVERNSAASRAGLKANDLIVSVDGKLMSEDIQLEDVLLEQGADGVATLQVLQSGTRLDLEVELDVEDVTRDFTTVINQIPMVSDVRHSGLILGTIVEEFAAELPESSREGVLVLDVERASPGYHAHLRAGDIITHVDGVPVSDPDNAIEAIASEDWDADREVRYVRGPDAGTTTISPVKNTQYDRDFWIPFVLRFQDQPGVRKLTVGPLGLVGHYTWRACYGEQDAPRDSTTWGLGAGAVRVDSRPKATLVRLAWIIPLKF